MRPPQHVEWNRQADLLSCFQIDEQSNFDAAPGLFFGPLLLTYGITLTILSTRLFSAVIWIGVIRNSSASSRAATVSK